ncbi:hypothetical protein TorRG33x02_310640 [Trema orientale]|uniref:Uncharacterized protein n=1 Tax=Trema orientale TaxID=63057 RepID=A0A2P5BSB1_TREOI|nr:hypothetical protein TorRG33x02_310640 [Trema orientale]
MDTNVDTLLVTQLGFDGYPTGDYIKNILGRSNPLAYTVNRYRFRLLFIVQTTVLNHGLSNKILTGAELGDESGRKRKVARASDGSSSGERRRFTTGVAVAASSASSLHGGPARRAPRLTVAAHVNSGSGLGLFGRRPSREEEGEVGGL